MTATHTSRAPAYRRRQQGAVAVILGLTLVVLVGFIGLAVDLGRFFVIKTELQNAMDACALSAASQLKPGANDPNVVLRAMAYGNVFSSGSPSDASVKNLVNFQSTQLDPNVLQISFSETNGGAYETTPPGTPNLALSNKAKFVKCEYPLNNLPIYFMKALNLVAPPTPISNTQTVRAMAVATRAEATAPCIPVAVCKSPSGTPANNFGHTVGEWIKVVGTNYGTGNFGWIDFTPPSGGSDELKASLQGSLRCDVNKTGAHVGAQGVNADLDEYWNSRFGWYKNLTTADAPPDYTGYAYANGTGGNWPSGFNAYNGTSSTGVKNFLEARAVYAPVQTASSGSIAVRAQPPGLPTNTYFPTSSADHAAHGRTDRRIVSAPIVDCSVWASGSNPGNAQPAIEGWACLLMLNPMRTMGPPTAPYREAKVEFRGLSTDPASACFMGSAGASMPVLTQ